MRFSDLDAYGHMNNSAFLTILEEARIQAFWKVPEDQLDYVKESSHQASVGPDSDTLTLVASHRIEYLRPLEFRRDGVRVDVWCTKLGGASATVGYRVWAPAKDDGQSTYAVAESTMVFVNKHSMKPRRLTESERQAWTDLMGDPVRFRGGR